MKCLGTYGKMNLKLRLNQVVGGKPFIMGKELSCNMNIKENVYKISSRWYSTPFRIVKRYEGSALYWRCNTNNAGSDGIIIKFKSLGERYIKGFMKLQK